MADRRADRPESANEPQSASRTRPTSQIHSARRTRPARQTEAAESRRRESWSGWGERNVAEKDGVGVFLDDVTYVFADVSILSIPALAVVMGTAPRHWFGVKGAALVAWMTMVGIGVLIRGGWVRPLATDALGWVSMTPWLIPFRLVYFNATLALAAFGGRAAEGAVSPLASTGIAPLASVGVASLASIGVAFVVGALGTLAFPRTAESFYGIVAE